MNLQKMGGVAVLFIAATFLVFAAVFAGILMPAGYLDVGIEMVQKVTIVAANQYVVSMTYFTGFVIFGVFLVVITLSLHSRLKAADPTKTRTTTTFGLIFAGLAVASGMVAGWGSSYCGVAQTRQGKNRSRFGWVVGHQSI